jgi:hypothetical protein
MVDRMSGIGRCCCSKCKDTSIPSKRVHLLRESRGSSSIGRYLRVGKIRSILYCTECNATLRGNSQDCKARRCYQNCNMHSFRVYNSRSLFHLSLGRDCSNKRSKHSGLSRWSSLEWGKTANKPNRLLI